MARDRYVILGVLGLAVCVALPLAHGLQWLLVQLEVFNPPVLGELMLTDVAAYGFAAAAAMVTLKHSTVRPLANEVVEELSKVTWPTREETGSATKVVVVAVVLSAAYLFIFDTVWLYVTDLILGVPQS